MNKSPQLRIPPACEFGCLGGVSGLDFVPIWTNFNSTKRLPFSILSVYNSHNPTPKHTERKMVDETNLKFEKVDLPLVKPLA